MKKRITLKDWTYIGIYNPAAKWVRPLCSYTLERTESGTFCREAKIGWFVYLILFIPTHLIQALWCVWDGGLRQFEIMDRYLGHDYFYEHDAEYNPAYNRAKEIWERA